MPELDKKEAQKLYDAVSKNFDIGTYDEFISKMQTTEERKNFYVAISEKFDIGDYEIYENRLKKKRFFRIFGYEITISKAF